MTPKRQGWIGMSLAAVIIALWTVLHVLAVFYFKPLTFGWSLVFVAGLTWLSVGLFIVAHDAMHGSLWPGHRRLGNLVGALALALYAGFSFPRLLPKHHDHHRYAGSPDDPDFAPDSPSEAFKWYFRFTLTYFGVRELVVMTLRVGAYLLLGAPMVNILLFFALPGILSSFQLFYFGTYLPHHHEHEHEHDLTQFKDTHHARSNEFGYLLSLLTCFHFGYHHEHHLTPGTPWWRLPDERKRLAL